MASDRTLKVGLGAFLLHCVVVVTPGGQSSLEAASIQQKFKHLHSFEHVSNPIGVNEATLNA